MLHWQKKIDNISSTTLRNKLRTVRKNYKTALSKLALDFKNKVLKFAGLHRIDALSATLLMYVFLDQLVFLSVLQHGCILCGVLSILLHLFGGGL